MRLLALSDLHLGHRANRDALPTLGDHRGDWLILAGDTGESPDHLSLALDAILPRFAKVIWTPGNHDLWSSRTSPDRTRGQDRYDELVAICRSAGVLTPEDPFAIWPGDGTTVIVPMFLLYDYSFRPSGIDDASAIGWAKETGVVCADELMLDATPWPSRIDWCRACVDATQTRLDALSPGTRTVLINHWPLRYDLARPPRIPRFSLWCGTTRTEDWAERYRARVVVNGHLHFRTTMVRHGVRYEEVSLGYPRDWRQERGMAWYLREILPGGGPDADRFVPARDPFYLPPTDHSQR